jgi:hypothetical protein
MKNKACGCLLATEQLGIVRLKTSVMVAVAGDYVPP